MKNEIENAAEQFLRAILGELSEIIPIEFHEWIDFRLEEEENRQSIYPSTRPDFSQAIKNLSEMSVSLSQFRCFLENNARACEFQEAVNAGGHGAGSISLHIMPTTLLHAYLKNVNTLRLDNDLICRIAKNFEDSILNKKPSFRGLRS